MMKKSSLALLKLGIFLAIGLSQTQADPIDDYLDTIDKEFERASTPTKKYEVVSRPINLDYLEELKSFKDLNEEALRQDTPYKTNPISLATSRGRADLVHKFLLVVPNVNALKLTSWGYRQPYFLTHMSLDPQYPRAARIIPLKDRLSMVDLLGDAGADFNLVCHPQLYTNPPLAAGEPSGHPLKNIMCQLRARALLYGADPQEKGSSFSGLRIDSWDKDLLDLALDYYIERAKVGATLRPVKVVMDSLKQLATKRGFDLEERVQKINTVIAQCHNLVRQRQACEARLQVVKLQKTKKAKWKRDQEQALLRELEEDDKKLHRVLKKL